MKDWLSTILGLVLGFSICINLTQHLTIEALKYKIQKCNAGPYQGIFENKNKDTKPIGDRMLQELIKKMLIEMENKKLRDNTI